MGGRHEVDCWYTGMGRMLVVDAGIGLGTQNAECQHILATFSHPSVNCAQPSALLASTLDAKKFPNKPLALGFPWVP